ncbi:hypothetical protein F2Q69_00014391 [Brassica cretica]|uniref:Uncharacterized protein n=1 Tax=Brassica cretica TaxID=69181 RepID=A0A8S9R8E0_BRACR|nr:hypothetical protein F2Q69_00014391 [Brassica cretica]
MKEKNAAPRQEKPKSQKVKQSEVVDDTVSKTQESTGDHDEENSGLSEKQSVDSNVEPPAAIVESQSNNETEWKLVGNGQKSPPRRETISINSETVACTGSPSRFHLLNNVEEGEVEASSSEEEETEETVVAQKVETSPKKSPDKTKKKKKNRVGATQQQPQHDQKRTAKQNKPKPASSRRL